ncbi:uncharacterized protein LOC131600122 [Vicia villosa]|uniref:uncharacterized protein LOC131600122 n=1 Tax=Vicia villosa TaxID=3911 RepID=UPI00273BC90F|nr:uncharacterized protein LOC131600122 [Vicia villosa]
MEVAVELDDDLFFADLSKQISLLIMDENEEDTPTSCHQQSLQSFSGAIYHPPPPQSNIMYEQMVLRRQESKGTGVFIPQSTTQPRRKQRRGRSSSSYAKYQKQSQDTTKTVSSK